MNDVLQEIAACIERAERIVVLTGAGVSAESGIPTFRDAQDGLWAKYDPMQLATPEAFARDPELVTRWYDHRREMCAACEPNAGHLANAELERWQVDRGREFTLVTQNVDRLHQDAGSRDPVELHGSIWEWRCTGCGEQCEDRQFPFAEYPPRCSCGGARRPGVVWFGESLDPERIGRAVEASERCDVFISVGTSSVVFPAAGLIEVARGSGARSAEINADRTPISDLVDWALHGRSGEVLPDLLARLGD